MDNKLLAVLIIVVAGFLMVAAMSGNVANVLAAIVSPASLGPTPTGNGGILGSGVTGGGGINPGVGPVPTPAQGKIIQQELNTIINQIAGLAAGTGKVLGF